MNIAIDIRTINKPRSGVGYYVTNLIQNLQEIDKNNHYCLISNNGEYENTFRSQSNFESHKTWVSNENHLIGDIWENVSLPLLLRKKGVNVFHGPAFMIPLLKGHVGTVVTIHDIVSFRMPHTIPTKYALYMQLLIRTVTKRAEMVITVSEFNKRELVELLNVPEKKIKVVHHGVSPQFKPAVSGIDKGALKSRFGINNRYMLFVSNLEPRKNLVRLMQAYDKVRETLNGEYQLVICGKKGWLYKDILKTYEQLKGEGNIIITNYVNEADLLTLYQNADMFVFPTLYEGFGLPVLEAMACGAPVITSNVSSLPEIAGDAAELIDPLSVEAISGAMLKLAGSADLRRSMRENGLRQAAKFSWKETARRTLEVYNSLS
ncbi:MAG: glycosyltransferase family 4 protein [Nitrospinae bacterium]|nr:glycosyltransferase family 4 protein [Nitrospinota bacterium]